jgi:hypothetical protein
MCVRACSRTYPARKAHAPYYTVICHLSWLCHIFQHYLLKGTVFEKKFLDMKYVHLFSLQVLFEIFLILRKLQRDIIINVHRSSYKLPVIPVGFEENPEFSRQIFEKYSIFKCCGKFVQWEPICSMQTDRRTDRHDEDNICLLPILRSRL